MASSELEVPDAPACPFLGLAADRRSHFTFPHPAHRCFVKNHAASADARRQSGFCLTPGFAACDRYRSWQSRQAAAAGKGAAQARDVPPATFAPPRSDVPQPAPFSELTASIANAAGPSTEPAGSVIHVFRAGDSLASIASKYGLTVGELLTANQLFADGPSDGTPLVIPLGGTPRRRSKTTRKSTSGK
jgi:LysM repeat protein